MSHRELPFTPTELETLAADYGTPFYLYDGPGIRAAAAALDRALAWVPGYRNYFAVKATPTPAILALLAEEGSGADCSSLAELVLAERVGLAGERLFFTSNNTSLEAYRAAIAAGAILNVDDIGHLPRIAVEIGLPPLVSLRYNPGPRLGGNAIIGDPVASKFGNTRAQLAEGYAWLRDAGVRRFGLHAMVVSNERSVTRLADGARHLFELAVELARELGIGFEFVNIGGGIGIPYRPDEAPVDLDHLSTRLRAAYVESLGAAGMGGTRLYSECGRLITGPHGYLVTRVRHIKRSYRAYAGLDCSIADLMRPALYGAYHHVSVPARAGAPTTERYELTGSLCENNDRLATDRALPRLEVGDLLVIHDVGAHGRAMAHNYNGSLRAPELLREGPDDVRLIRRRESLDDLFATTRGLEAPV